MYKKIMSYFKRRSDRKLRERIALSLSNFDSEDCKAIFDFIKETDNAQIAKEIKSLT